VVDVDKQLHALKAAGDHHLAEPSSDGPRLEEDGGDQHGGCPVVDLGHQTLADRRRGVGRHLDHLEAFLGQPVELTPDRVELPVGRDHARSLAERQGGEKAEDELVRVLGQGDPLGLVAQQAREAEPHAVGLGERPVPFFVRQLRRIQPGLLLPLEAAVGPCLVRVARETETFGDAEPAVAGRQRVRRPAELLRAPDRESFVA
jgi:hypothetical protein